MVVIGCALVQLTAHLRQNQNAIAVAPKSGRFVKFGTENIFIQETGPANGEAVFFIHGTGSWSELWRPTMDQLAVKGFYSVAIDLPPFGFSFNEVDAPLKYDRQSQANRIIAVIKSLNIKKVTLVGHSFGGQATLTTAFLIPEMVNRLILVSIALGFGDQTDPFNPARAAGWVDALLNFAFFRNTLLGIGTAPSLTKTFVDKFVANPATVTESVTDIYKRPLVIDGKSEQIGDWLRDAVLSSDKDLVKKIEPYQMFTAPVNLIWGDLDKITPLWQAEKLSTMFKAVKMFSFPNVGHLPMIEEPKQFQDTVQFILTQDQSP